MLLSWVMKLILTDKKYETRVGHHPSLLLVQSQFHKKDAISMFHPLGPPKPVLYSKMTHFVGNVENQFLVLLVIIPRGCGRHIRKSSFLKFTFLISHQLNLFLDCLYSNICFLAEWPQIFFSFYVSYQELLIGHGWKTAPAC